MPCPSFVVRCSACDFYELWGLQQAVVALTAARKLSPLSEFDADLFGELLLVHIGAVRCPGCGRVGTLSAGRARPHDWTWDDVVRCEDCGEEIPEARRLAVPGAKRCVRCQQEFERGGL